MLAVRCKGRLVDFRGNSGLVCQTDRLEDIRQLELEGLGKEPEDETIRKRELQISPYFSTLPGLQP